jgi:hypothetical protein
MHDRGLGIGKLKVGGQDQDGGSGVAFKVADGRAKQYHKR